MSKRIVLLQALASTERDLALILRSVDDVAARRPPGPEAWSIVQTLAHLVEVETRQRERLRRILAEERPWLPYLHPVAADVAPTARVDHLLAAFAAARGQTLALLKTVTPGQWQRPAQHASRGNTTFRFMVQAVVDHDTEHLNQIAHIVQQLHRVPARDARPAIPAPEDSEV